MPSVTMWGPRGDRGGAEILFTPLSDNVGHMELIADRIVAALG